MSQSTRNGRAKRAKKPVWIARAERSWRRVARQIRAESRRLGLKPVVFEK